MDPNYLDTDEIIVELKIRNLWDDSSDYPTVQLVQRLEERLEEEANNQIEKPTKTHTSASKKPVREIKTCAEKLEFLRQLLQRQDPTKDLDGETAQRAGSKLHHIHGRLVRMQYSRSVQGELPQLFKAHTVLAKQLDDAVTRKITTDDMVTAVTTVSIPVIDLNEEEIQHNDDKDPSSNAPNKKPNIPKNKFEVYTDTKDPRDDSLQDPDSSSNEDEKPDPDDKRRMQRYKLKHDKGSGSSIPSSIHGSDGLKDHSEMEEISTTELPLDSKVCKNPSTWNLRFEGARGDIHVERFFYRVERMAIKSHITLNSLVDYMSLLLGGEALEWYWTYLERNNQVKWEGLKTDMIQRFQSSRSDDDVHRLLSQRKQLYPRESFLDFHDAILRLALQAKKPIRDQQIYNILRRNMRPGLQLELFEEKKFPSVSHFVRKCVSLEELWKRFGVNPEAKLSMPQTSYGHHNNYNPGGNRFQPRVHEVVVQEPVYLEEDDYQDELGDYNNELCALNNQHQRNKPNNDNPAQQLYIPPQQRNFQPQAYRNNQAFPQGDKNKPPINIVRRPEANREFRTTRPIGCFNCESEGHTFFDCRVPIRHVFCFGCGLKGVYKPDCITCKRAENWRSEMRGRESQLVNTSRQETANRRMTTEETASNTDPELHQRR